VHYPEGWSTRKLREQIKAALVEATKRSYMRPNAVDAIYDKNTGNNLGGDDFPYIHFEEIDADEPLVIELMLKGGGCENVGAQYSLPDNKLGAGRDLAGVRKVVLDAVQKAQGKGCAPGILGVSIGGDRGSSYIKSKEVLFSKMGRRNEDPKIAELGTPHERSERDGHRSHGLRRPDHSVGYKDHRDAPPARFVLCVCFLHVLGLSPPQDGRHRR
jgi:fumarate hydratase class I